MCIKCIAKGIIAAIFAGIFATLFFATFWIQASIGGPPISALSFDVLLQIFLQYAVAVFFLGLAKWVKMTMAKDCMPVKTVKNAGRKR